MRLGHESRVEIVGASRSFDCALEQEAIERRRHGVAVLQVDLELSGAGFLHHRIDGQALSFRDPVDVVDERTERIHFLELERHRPFGIGGETGRCLQREVAVGRTARNVEFKLHGNDGLLSGSGEPLDLRCEHAARTHVAEFDRHHHRLCMRARACRNGLQRARKNAERNVVVARLPKTPRFRDRIAARVQHVNRCG